MSGLPRILCDAWSWAKCDSSGSLTAELRLLVDCNDQYLCILLSEYSLAATRATFLFQSRRSGSVPVFILNR